jgi:Cellulase (glycosyl hydrolase family 5)
VLRLAALLSVAALAAAAAASAATQRHHRAYARHVQSTPATHPLRTAIMEPYLFPFDQQQEAFKVARGTGATYVRMAANWAELVPAALPFQGFDPSDPDSPGYTWAGLDQEVQAAENAGLTPILDIGDPPSWGLSLPRKADGGGTPDITALADFAHAIATHYDGSHGAPAVQVYQVWNEANLSLDLDPVSAAAYRSMVNAVADQVHGVDPHNVVVAGALDPFKNRTKRFHTVAPLAFMRKLLCVSKGAHPHATCQTPVEFDVWSHHPYTFGGPFAHARLADDVSLGDLPRMTELLRTAERLHRIVSAHKVEFWVTEFAWDTKPPNPHAMPMSLQVRATAGALYQMWRSGVSLATWFLLQDHPLKQDPYQCGLYFGGRPIGQARAKPTLRAFRFPFVAFLHPSAVSIWGRDATSTKKVVTIQFRHGIHGRWKTVARIRTNRYGIFVANLRLSAAKQDWLRARADGSGTSVAYSLAEPHYPHIGPWGN